MRLCVASPLFYPTYGGSQLRFARYLPVLRAQGIEVEVFTGTPKEDDVTAYGKSAEWSRYAIGDSLPVERLDGVPVYRVRLPDRSGWRRTYVYNRALLDFCHAADTAPEVLQIVGNLRPVSIPWIRRIKALGIAVVYSVTISSKILSSGNPFSIRQAAFRTLFNSLDCIVTNNAPLKDMLEKMGIKTRIEVIPNGVDTSKFAPSTERASSHVRKSLGISANDPVIVSIGAVIPRKGSDLLLEAWSRVVQTHGNAHLIFVGPRKWRGISGVDDFNARLDELVRRSGRAENVHFVDFTDDVPAYLHAADIFVLASKREGMPNAVLESMAAGVPVIMTPFAGLSSDLGEDRQHHILVDRDSRALASVILELLNNPDLRQKLAINARQLVEHSLSLENSVFRYLNLYTDLAMDINR